MPLRKGGEFHVIQVTVFYLNFIQCFDIFSLKIHGVCISLFIP